MSKHITQLHDITPSELQEGILRHIEFKLKEIINSLDTNQKVRLLTREQTADMLSITLSTLWAWTKKGILKSYRIGNKIMYKQHEVLQSIVEINHKNERSHG